MKVDRLLYAGNNLDKARSLFSIPKRRSGRMFETPLDPPR